MFIVAGSAFAKYTEHWPLATPPVDHWLPATGMASVQAAAAVGVLILVMAGLALFAELIVVEMALGLSIVYQQFPAEDRLASTIPLPPADTYTETLEALPEVDVVNAIEGWSLAKAVAMKEGNEAYWAVLPRAKDSPFVWNTVFESTSAVFRLHFGYTLFCLLQGP